MIEKEVSGTRVQSLCPWGHRMRARDSQLWDEKGWDIS